METEQFKDTEKVETEAAEKKEDITDHIIDLSKTYYKLTVLKAAEKATNIGASVITGIALATLGVMAVLFASFGLGWWLGDLVDSRPGGFMILAGFYLLLTIIVIAMRRKIVFPFIRNLLIRKYYD